MTHVKFYHTVKDRHCANCEREIHRTTQYGRAVHTSCGELQERVLCLVCANDFELFSRDLKKKERLDIDEVLIFTTSKGNDNRQDLHYDDLMHRERELT